MRFGLVAIALAACGRPVPQRVVVPAEGISIAVYADDTASVAVVDDRRWIEVTGRSILLDRIEHAAALPSLVIEPLAGGRLGVGACVRERLDETADTLDALARSQPQPRLITVIDGMGERKPGEPGYHVERQGMKPGTPLPIGVVSPLVRCAVTGAPGRYLVRVLYVVSTLGYRAQHDVAMIAPDRATIATRFAFTTPRWKARAEVVLHEGLPGRDEPPREVARGPVVLDGGTAVIALPPREVAARLRTVYDGMAPKQTAEPTDIVWGKDSQQTVWVWLELDGGALPRGPVHAHVEVTPEGPRDADIAADARERDAGTTRLPVWIDPSLRGMRQRWVDHADGATLADRFQLSVSNLGDAPREVWVEERLRPARRREIARGWPQKPAVAGKVARTHMVLAPGKIERVGFTIQYDL